MGIFREEEWQMEVNQFNEKIAKLEGENERLRGAIKLYQEYCTEQGYLPSQEMMDKVNETLSNLEDGK